MHSAASVPVAAHRAAVLAKALFTVGERVELPAGGAAVLLACVQAGLLLGAECQLRVYAVCEGDFGERKKIWVLSASFCHLAICSGYYGKMAKRRQFLNIIGSIIIHL